MQEGWLGTFFAALGEIPEATKNLKHSLNIMPALSIMSAMSATL